MEYNFREIEDAFKADVFSKELRNTEQLTNSKNKALDYFKGLVAKHKEIGIQYSPKQADYNLIGNKVWEEYQGRIKKEVIVLKNGFQDTLHNILNAYLLTLQLVVEWIIIAKQQVEKSEKLNVPTNVLKPFSENHVLETLRTHIPFQNLLKERNLTWNEHIPIVVRWYNQFVKSMEGFKDLSTSEGGHSKRDYAIFQDILEKIIEKQEDIQNYFGNLYLGWEEIKLIVKNLCNYLDSSSILELFQHKGEFMEPAVVLYTNLIDNILEKDTELDDLLKQYSKEWSLERCVLLDRIIIKLGLCEMHYLSETPAKVVISEYVYLAKRYSTDKSLGFVNGILDSIAKEYNLIV